MEEDALIPIAIRNFVWNRAGGKCEDCGSTGDFRGLAIHHVNHKGMGGSKRLDHSDNLKLLCGKCHSKAHGIKEN